MLALPLLAGACGPSVTPPEAGTTTGSDAGSTTAATSSASDHGDDTWDPGRGLDVPALPPGPPAVDILLVVDNSASMAEEQRNLAHNLLGIVRELEAMTDTGGSPVAVDVQLMVTTTDRGAPLCARTGRYAPTGGQPVTTGCNARIDHFTDPSGTVSMPEACTELCPVDLVPDGDFLRFGPRGTNLPEAPEIDLDGDGEPESAAAQVLACVGMQGIVGCEYESTLESMQAALDPSAPWNTGAEPFLRDDAILFVLLVTDEPDCSVQDASLFADTSLTNVDPETMLRSPSSAMCWNASVSCTGPDADGVYTGCHSRDDSRMYGIDRYLDRLREMEGKQIIMGAVVGVPPVTAHDRTPPFQPVAGGIFDLVVHDWHDPQFPDGDILPGDWADGTTAAVQHFRYGIGPGCTRDDGTVTAQAMPPVRIAEVCAGLDEDDTVGCCIESICDSDFSAVIRCMTVIPPQCPSLAPCG